MKSILGFTMFYLFELFGSLNRQTEENPRLEAAVPALAEKVDQCRYQDLPRGAQWKPIGSVG